MQTEELASWRLPEWFPDLTAAQLNQLKIHHSELLKFNGRINLISPRTEKTADLTHFADGVLASRLIRKATDAKEIYDLGAGNGIPGLVYAALNHDVLVHLVDADSRKCEFIKHSASRMELKNVRVSNLRVEEIPENAIQCGMARGLASVAKTLVMTRKACASGCEFFHLKSDSWATEVAEIPSQVLAHWEPQHLADYPLPAGTASFSIVVTTKK